MEQMEGMIAPASASIEASMRRLHSIWPSLLLVLAGIPLILLEPFVVEGHDERLYHLPVIRQFAAQMPWPDIRDYPAAMAPLYHLLLAVPFRAGLDDIVALRMMTLGIAAISVAAVWWFFAAFATPRRAAVLAAAIGLSPYYLGPSIFLASDNFAFGCMAVVLGVCARAAGPPRLGVVAIASTAAVLARQLYFWLILLGAWDAYRRRVTGAALAWLLLPGAALGGLIWIWGGPVTPSFVQHREPAGLLPALMILGTLGPWAVPLLPAFAEGADRRRALTLFALMGVAALCYLAFDPFSASHPAPWGGAMRTLGKYVPALAGTSLLFWPAILLGTLTLALLLSRPLAAHERMILIAFALWTAAQSTNAAMQERYYQPFVLLVLFGFAASMRSRRATFGIAAIIAMIALTSTLRFLVHGTGLFRF
jgi:hypothetical protein